MNGVAQLHLPPRTSPAISPLAAPRSASRPGSDRHPTALSPRALHIGHPIRDVRRFAFPPETPCPRQNPGHPTRCIYKERRRIAQPPRRAQHATTARGLRASPAIRPDHSGPFQHRPEGAADTYPALRTNRPDAATHPRPDAALKFGPPRPDPAHRRQNRPKSRRDLVTPRHKEPLPDRRRQNVAPVSQHSQTRPKGQVLSGANNRHRPHFCNEFVTL